MSCKIISKWAAHGSRCAQDESKMRPKCMTTEFKARLQTYKINRAFFKIQFKKKNNKQTNTSKIVKHMP